MVKKNKNRHCQESPTIHNGGDSAESGDQKKTRPNGSGCMHIQKAVQLASIKKSLKNGCLASDCPGCIKDGVKPDGEECVPNAGLWLCLQCGHQGCGRAEKQHALKHFQVVHSDPHCIAVNTTSWNVWCYSCEVELASEYRKKLQECVKYLKNVDCPSSARHSTKACAADGNQEGESAESTSMPLADVTNMPHGVRASKKKMVSLPRVRGLQNLGNTCFLNSVLQCLAQTPHFLELLQETQQGGTRFCLAGGRGLLPKPEGGEEEDDELPPLEGTLTKWGTLTESLASTLEELRQDETTTVNPLRLFNKLITKCPQFKGGDQHDAHELLRHLLDEVRTEDLKRYWVAILDQYGLSRHDTNETVESSVRAQVRAYGRQAGELWLLPDPVFRGILVSTVECQDCLHSYQRTEPFYELSLPVTTNKPQPPVMRRKAGGDDSFDVCGNVTNETPSKHQLKKERRQQRKVRKKYQPQSQKDVRTSEPSSEGASVPQDANNGAESEQSDADVEDNVEQEVALKEVRPGERLVNGDVSSIDLKLCNGNVSDNENIEVERTVTEQSEASRRVDSEGLICSDQKMCNGTRHGEEIDQENRTDAHSAVSQHVSWERKATDNRERSLKVRDVADSKECQENRITEEKLKSIQEIEMPLALPWKDVEVDGNEVKEGFSVLVQGNKLTNGTLEESEEIGNTGDSEGNKKILEYSVCEKASIGTENVEFMDTTNDSTYLRTKDIPSKDEPSQELSLFISPTVNSPSALGSPISQTGSPSSVSSDINVDLNISNLVPSNSWPVEDTDRPFSRIAFCNDDDSLTLHNDSLQSLSPAANAQGGTQKPASEEGVCLGLPTADQLAKEMVGLSIGHDERQSPSHWDTCSAHSLEDLKEAKMGLSLEVPLCNGGGKTSDPAPLEDADKSSTLAPRYHCGDKECSIESCLNQFTLLELMTGSCKVICESCSERINKGKEGKMVATNSTKQYLVSNPPAVLVLHLKRFEVHQNMFRKTPRHVTFPMLLDIAPICNTKCRELPTIRRGQTKVLYSLYGVVQHSGTLHGGHYSAYVKVRAPVKRDDMRWCFLPTAQSTEQLEELSKGANVPSEPLPGKWFHVSDSRVTEVNEDRVLHSQAYLLFYERVW
ncbi:hypothetical protein R5R35_008168 [Gryllus longicercus]|uniref:Ubiquitinyl hydrolase 1 n=1 Tax=Gryllus longicercus TaxID=2509291 RepID=A0AAN9VV84_9ORTH